MSKFKLIQMDDSAHPYQYYARAHGVSPYSWDESLLQDIRAFLKNHTGSGGYGCGEPWWHSEHTDRIYMREQDMTFFVIKFGHLVSDQAD